MSLELETVASWDFTTGSLISNGRVAVALVPQYAAPEWLPGEGLRLREGQWLQAADSTALRCDGPFRLVAEIRRASKSNGYCEAIAGVWDEQRDQRQYALFLSAMNARNRVVGHISAHGGNAPGQDHCRSAALGNTEQPFGIWITVELWWDGVTAGVVIDGRPDGADFAFPGPLHVSDAVFTVGAVPRKRPPIGIGNFFVGDLRRLALWR
jgi:hypothetical protein